MTTPRWDDNGWALLAPNVLPVHAAYSLFAPDASSHLDAARLAHQAQRFFATTLVLEPTKRYPEGGYPTSDEAVVRVRDGDTWQSVRLLTVPLNRGTELMPAARSAVEAMGGAGFDALLNRAKRIWQVDATVAGRASLLTAAVLASLLLAPVLPPQANRMFGVKGARELLARLAED